MNFGFLKRGRKAEALKFDFELRAMEIVHESLAGKLVCVKWSRGSKKSGVSKNVVCSSDGRAVWAHDEPLKLTATLFRSKPTSLFDSKEIKLSLEEVVKAGKTKTLGSSTLNLARYADSSLTVASNRVELRLKGKEAEGGEMRCIVKSQHRDAKSGSQDRSDHSSPSFSGSEALGQSCDDSPRSSFDIDDSAIELSEPRATAPRERDEAAARRSHDYTPANASTRTAERLAAAAARGSIDESARASTEALGRTSSWRAQSLRSLGSSTRAATAGEPAPPTDRGKAEDVPAAPPRRERVRGGPTAEVGYPTRIGDVAVARDYEGQSDAQLRIRARSKEEGVEGGVPFAALWSRDVPECASRGAPL